MIEKAIAAEREYLQRRLNGEDVTLGLSEYGFDNLDDYFAAKKEYRLEHCGIEAHELPIKEAVEGNIRIVPEKGGIDLSVAPTEAQRHMLARYVASFRGEVILDIDGTDGQAITSVEYPKDIPASFVLKDIDDYFGKGKVPEPFTSGVKYSRDTTVSYDYSKPFAEQVDDWIDGKIPKYDTLVIGGTPAAFKRVGFNALPMTINQSHVAYAINGTKNTEHHIGEALLKQLPDALKNPVAIIASKTEKGTSVVTSEIFNIQMKQAAGEKLKASDYKRLSQTITVVAIAAVVNSALAAIIDAWRDDDDYATFKEKWLAAWKAKLVDELNPLTYFPIASTAWDFAKSLMDTANMKFLGVEVYGNNTDIPIADIFDQTNKALEIFMDIKENGEESKYTKYGGYYKVVSILSKVSGIPAYNIMREISDVNNNLFPDHKWLTYDAGETNNIKYAFEDGYLTEDEAIEALQNMSEGALSADEAWIEVNKWKNSNDSGTTSDYVSVYDAIDNDGDIRGAVKDMQEHGKEDGDIRSALTRRYKEAYIAGDATERAKIRKALYATGLYGSANDVVEKCNGWLKEDDED